MKIKIYHENSSNNNKGVHFYEANLVFFCKKNHQNQLEITLFIYPHSTLNDNN